MKLKVWGFVLGGLIYTLSTLVEDQAVWASQCSGFLARLENSRLKSAVSFSAHGRRPAEVNGFPLHFTSNPIIPFIWLTNPDHDSQYFVVRKGDSGFGFQKAPVREYQLLNDPDIHLRSLDFSGDGQNLLATMVAKDAATEQSSLVLKLANISDSTTGELSLLGTRGLEIADIASTKEHLIVSPRPQSKEFWITDGSSVVRVVSIQESGEPVLATSVDLRDHDVELISKVQFFPNPTAGYMRLKKSDGTWWLVPFVLKPVEKAQGSKKKSDDGMHLQMAWEEAYAIQGDYVRTSAHPTEPIILIAYKDRIEGVGINIESQSLTKVLDQNIDFLQPGQEILGVDFYWNGALKKVKTDQGPQMTFQGKVEAALLVGQNNRKSTLLYWLDLKTP